MGGNRVIFSLDVRRARKGDCLLLHYGTKENPRLAIIDGGPSRVYEPHLKPRLDQIRNARHPGADEPLTVDMIMVSHADEDHIQGILDLTREMLATPHAPRLRVLSLWHNSFDEVIDRDPSELMSAMAAQFGAASLESGLPDDASVESDRDEDVTRDALKVLASVGQGFRLRGEAESLGIQRNPEFDGKLILAESDPVTVVDDLEFVVAGPLRGELLKLQRKHDEWLRTKKDDPEAALAAYVDDSVTNLSSIVVLARSKKKSMLLTGDARGDRILQGLEQAGVLKPGRSMTVDILKVPHHGSSRNVEPAFFERIKARHYVISGNGEHGNPERETMEMIFSARKKEPFEIHLTYPIRDIDVQRKADWAKEQAKEKKRKEKGSSKPVRENWSAAKHSLAALVRKTQFTAEQRISIVDAKKRHVIDLLEPIRL
jgi:hypothetical protein